jgi:hypothetical protein
VRRTTGTRSAQPKCARRTPKRPGTARRRAGGIRRARGLTYAVLDPGHGPHLDHVRHLRGDRLYLPLGSVGYEPELKVRAERR